MKLFKKFLIWLAIALGILIACFLGIFAYMYFAPGNSVLGYEYVLTNDKSTKTYTNSTELSVGSINALEILTTSCDIYIFPNTESGELKIEKSLNFSGLARSVNAKLKVNESIETRSFEEKENTYSTFRIVVNEPSGWISSNKSHIIVRVPTNININTIYARSDGGNVYYNSNKESSVLRCSDLYLKTNHHGTININNSQAINNYYLTSGEGKVVFSENNSITCDNIKFYTNRGTFNMTNAAGSAVLNVNNFSVYSNEQKVGPQIVVNKLNGNLSVEAQNGYYKINEIGSHSNYKTVAMTLTKSNINFGTVYGFVSLLSNSGQPENNVSINKLEYTGQTHTFETGKGSLNIGSLNGNIAVDASSGDIRVSEATATNNVYVYTTSGNVNVNYKKSAENNKNTMLKVITYTGNINLSNVSCGVEVKVMENSANSSLNLGFCAKATVDSVVEAKNRKVNLKVTTLENRLRFRILSTKAVQYIGPKIGEDILSGDHDYLLETAGYENFAYSYRIGYVKDESVGTHYQNNSFNMWGKLLIYTTNDVVIEEDVLA